MTAPLTAVQISEVTSALAGVCERVGHSEIYGIDLLAPENTDPVKLLAGKYLRAHGLDPTAALAALEATLAWRKSFDPRSAAFEEVHDPKFEGLGYITLLGDGADRDVVTWNIYGECDRFLFARSRLLRLTGVSREQAQLPRTQRLSSSHRTPSCAGESD